MRKGTSIFLVIIVVAAFMILTTVNPLANVLNPKGADQPVSLKMVYQDATTAMIGLNGTNAGQVLGLDGAVIRLGRPVAEGTNWSSSWTIQASAWQGEVQKLGSSDISLVVIDQDQDRKMGSNDRIQIRKDLASDASEMTVGVRFTGNEEVDCHFTFSNENGSVTSVSFIDVGQGDSILISTADSRTILIDAGPPLAAGALVSYLHNRSVSVIDALIITHPDADHLGGASDVLRDFTVLSVYHPGLARNTSAYSSFIHAAVDEGCPIHNASDTNAGDYLDLTASATFEVLSIDATASDSNDASIVLEMRTPAKSFLFTGDISSTEEDKLMANHSFDLDIDVLKVSHHGSGSSTSVAFLEATTPMLAIISVGENGYGHPSNDTLSRLYADDITVLRTDQMGTIDIIA